MAGFMPPSPKGREIEHVEGSPDDIIKRGNDIETLGQKMLDSADTLQRLHDNTFSGGAQQGKAIEKLQDTIGDSYKTLKEAGELYQPVGPVIAQYGDTLQTYKPLIDNTADTCEDLWTAYEALPGDKEGSTTPEAGGGVLGIGGHDADSPEAKQEAADNQAKKQAYDEWENAADRFDTWYDVWEDAFEEASAGVEDKMAGAIKDSFWDDWGDIISAAYEILTWAALIIGVIAIFCTGFGALAAILALAAFALSAVKYAAGQESLGQLGLDALAIIPVGKLTNLSKIGHLANMAKGSKLTALSRTWGAVEKGPISKLTRAAIAKDPLKLKSGSQVMEGLFGKSFKAVKSENLKMYMGNYDALKNGLGTFRGISRVEWGIGRVGSTLGTIGIGTKATQGTNHFDPIPIDVPDVKIPGMPKVLSF